MAEQQQSQQQKMNAASAGRGLSLPPGFRFHPSDDEIVSIYLMNKVYNREINITCIIPEVDLNKIEPWDLPREAKMGEKEWCFFYQKDRKYPTGLRANRATKVGYWKATGKDKEVYNTKEGVVLLVGMKKTLVFYKGRAPRGEKTNWVMHEYRLEGSGRRPDLACASSSTTNLVAMKALSSTSKDEWVICRVFDKTTRIKKTTTPGYKVAMVGTEIDQNQNNIPAIPIPMPPHMPMPMQFPIPPDFATDPVAPYFPNSGSGLPPMMPSMPGIGGAGMLQSNSSLFGNLIATLPQMNLYHHTDMGAAAGHVGMGVAGQMNMGAASTTGSFDVDAPRLSSMVSQKDEQANAAEIWSMMSIAGPGSASPTIEMDGTWKY